MAAMTGWGMARRAGTIPPMYSMARMPIRWRPMSSVPGGMPACSSSSPEQKARPAPVRTTTRHELSAPTSARAS